MKMQCDLWRIYIYIYIYTSNSVYSNTVRLAGEWKTLRQKAGAYLGYRHTLSFIGIEKIWITRKGANIRNERRVRQGVILAPNTILSHNTIPFVGIKQDYEVWYTEHLAHLGENVTRSCNWPTTTYIIINGIIHLVYYLQTMYVLLLPSAIVNKRVWTAAYSATNCFITVQVNGLTQGLQASASFTHYWYSSFFFKVPTLFSILFL